MENAAIPLLNFAILGAFMVLALRELGNLSTQAVKIRDEEKNV